MHPFVLKNLNIALIRRVDGQRSQRCRRWSRGLRHSAIAAGFALVFATVSVAPAAASGSYAGAGTRARMVEQTFRLNVSGRIASSATFWVAYGPLDGRFGVIRLHRVGSGKYAAHQLLPLGGSSVFAYLEGHGTVTTRIGPAPGDPTTTIKQVGPVIVSRAELPAVQWQAPVG